MALAPTAASAHGWGWGGGWGFHHHHFGHGFGIGPGAGKLVADMVAGDPTLVDPAPFHLSRFTDGSNPQPHPLAS